MGRNAVGRASPYGVLYREGPAWLVPDGAEGSGLPYPGDHAGIVIAVRPEGYEWGPGDLADARRKLVTLELTPDEVGRLSSGELKIAGGKPAKVSFDDRWGAIAPALRARFGSLEGAQIAEEKARVNAGRIPGDLDAAGREFASIVASLMKALPQVVVCSGAGLYEIGPGKTYSTIQSALDQLWSDQGSAAFTAKQTIRVYAGTYDDSNVLKTPLRRTRVRSVHDPPRSSSVAGDPRGTWRSARRRNGWTGLLQGKRSAKSAEGAKA